MLTQFQWVPVWLGYQCPDGVKPTMNFVALLVAYYFSGALDDVSGFPFIASKRAEKLNETKVSFVSG